MLNPDMTLTGEWMFGVASAIGAMCFGYVARRAWRSTPQEWNAWNLRLRPRSWDRWPIYGALWRDVDRHPTLYLWQARLVGILGLGMCISGVMVSLAAIVRE
jgi:hypothetical protein